MYLRNLVRGHFNPCSIVTCLDSVIFQVKEAVDRRRKRKEGSGNGMEDNQEPKVSSPQSEVNARRKSGEADEIEERGTFRSKCAKCMDPCVKIALITFPIFLIASILIGILGLSSSQVSKDNSTDASSPPYSYRNVTRFKVPTSTSTMIFRSDIIHTSANANNDEDTHFYSILFLILALTSLIVIFCGKYWTIGLYTPPPDADFSTNPTGERSSAQAVRDNVLEEQMTTV